MKTSKEVEALIEKEQNDYYNRIDELVKLLAELQTKEQDEAVSSIEKEWIEQLSTRKDEIDAKMEYAMNSFNAALHLSEIYGIPFLSKLVVKPEWYIPNSFYDKSVDKIIPKAAREKLFGIDPDDFERTWQSSSLQC